MNLRLQMVIWGFILSSQAWAGSTNTSMGVSATVTANCTIVTSPVLNFGNYTGTTVTKEATLKVNCTNQAPYRIAMGPGNGSASVTDRKMTSGSNTLSYALYQDSNRTVNWGQTANSDDMGKVGDGTDQSITIYGKILGGITAAVGNYSDTVQVVINY